MATSLIKKRKRWCSDDMQKAIEAVRSKSLGYLAAAKRFSVPRATLFRLCNTEGNPETVCKTKLGKKPVLTPELENELVQYLLIMDQKFFGLTRRDVRSMAFQLARRNNLPHPFSLLRESAGKDWFSSFMNRHKATLSLRKPTGTSIARAVGFNRENVTEFFDLLEKVMAENHYGPDRIYNVDESGLCIVQSRCPEVVSMRGKRQVGALTSAERGSLVTIVLCMNAAGDFVPPMIIFPRKKSSDQLKKGAPAGSLFAFHPSGWIQTDLFTKWFDHFLEKTKPSATNPILLVLDGHHTHTRNLDVILKAKERFVTILCLPPHTTHKMQPLDKTVMGALKTFYNEEVRIFMRTENRAVTHFDVCQLLGRAYLKVQSGERSVKGFSATGIYPVRRNIFTDEEFAAEIQKDNANLSANTEPTNVGNNISTNVLPSDIVPVPKLIKKTGTRGRKSGRSKIITSTPEKEELEQSINLSREKVTRKITDKAGPSGLKTKKLKPRKEHVPTSSSESESDLVVDDSPDDNLTLSCFTTRPDNADVQCIFCQENFSMSRPREIWVRCVICNEWAHEACTSAEGDIFVCDFCKN